MSMRPLRLDRQRLCSPHTKISWPPSSHGQWKRVYTKLLACVLSPNPGALLPLDCGLASVDTASTTRRWLRDALLKLLVALHRGRRERERE